MDEKYNHQTIENNLKFFGHLEAGGVTEVRILPKERYLVLNGRREYVGRTVSGYYNDYVKLVEDISSFDGKGSIYFTLNPCKQELMYRATNRLEFAVTQTTTDDDILCDLWFPIDIDPVTPVAGISSSDMELSSVIKKQGEIISYFAHLKIDCVPAKSGNGCHLLIRMIPYPNETDIREQKKALMQFLSEKFSDEEVNVDNAVHNMGRIWKLYGTMACKGDPSEERPHRRSKLYLPDEPPHPVDLYTMTEHILPPKTPPKSLPGGRHGSPPESRTSSPPHQYAPFDVEAYLNQWGGVWRKQEKKDMVWYQFAECPVHTDHDEHQWECGICQSASGKMGAKCMHNESYGWADFKEKLGDIKSFLSSEQLPVVATPLKSEAPGETVASCRVAFPNFPESAWRGVFAEFRDAHYDTTEAPTSFLFGAMSAVIGALMGRKCHIQYGLKTYPNMYLALIGETAKSHKSTAASKAEDLLKKVDPSVLCYQNLATAEGLIELLVPLREDDEEDERARLEGGADAENLSPKFQAQMTRLRESTNEFEGFRLLAYIDEFSSLLKKATRESSSGLIEAITLAYNCPSKLDNPTRISPLRAPNPTLSIITTTTVGKLMKHLMKEDTEGGFANRFTYFYGSSEREIDWPAVEDIGKLNSVVMQLKQARLRWQNTEFRLLDSARELWKPFYHKWKVTQDGDTIDSITSRLPTNAVKQAMQFALMENDAPEINPDQLQAAIDIAEYWYEVIKILFSGYGLSEEQVFEQQVLDALSNGGKSRKELYEVFSRNINARQLNTALDSLFKMEKVIKFHQKTKGRPRVVYQQT